MTRACSARTLLSRLDQGEGKQFRFTQVNTPWYAFFTFQTSKDAIVAFSKDFLQGEGNVIKHLTYLGYELDHKQTPLDEFDFAVTNIAVDLKDGVRLW